MTQPSDAVQIVQVISGTIIVALFIYLMYLMLKD